MTHRCCSQSARSSPVTWNAKVSLTTQRAPQHLVSSHKPAARRKLDALNVLKAVTVEQRCEASILTHIDDGIAIAYLDGTLAVVNPMLLTFAGLTSRASFENGSFRLAQHSSAQTFLTNLRSLCDVCYRAGVEYEGELNFEAKSQILNLRISLLLTTRENVQTSQSASLCMLKI